MREDIITSLTRALLAKTLGRDFSSDDPQPLEVANVLRHKIQAMPFILRTAMTILTHAFNGYGLVLCGKPFCRQNPQQRLRQIAQWKNGPLGLCRAFIGFYEKMTTFIYFSLCPLNV